VKQIALVFGLLACVALPVPGLGAADDGLPVYHLRIKDKALRRLLAHHEEIRDQAFLAPEDREWFPARLEHAGESHRVKIRLRGDLPVHWRGEKQSYRVKFRDAPFRGQAELNLIVPWDKHYAVEWLQTRVADELGLLYFPGRFVDLVINGEPAGLYYENEHPTRDYLERHGRAPSSIFTFGASWTRYFGMPDHHIAFELTGSTATPPIESIGQIKQRRTYASGDEDTARRQRAYVEDFYRLLTEGSVAEVARLADRYLDLDNFARYVALQNYFGSDHGMALNDNTRLYLDPTSGKFEFIPWDIALWSLAERADELDLEGAELLTPRDPVFRKIFDAYPGVRARRDAVLRALLARSDEFAESLDRAHARLLRSHPDDERLRQQRARHDEVLRDNHRLLAEWLGAAP